MVTFDFSDITRVTRNLERFADQIPFAMAQALNKAADQAREELPAVWAEHITVRNPNFLKAALTTRGARATKRNLRVELYDQFGRGNLNLHDEGGTARSASSFAIPTTSSGIKGKRGSKGVPKGLRPRNLANSFAKPGKSGDLVIFQRTGRYQKATKAAHRAAAKEGVKRAKGKDGRGLKLEYVTHPSKPIRADVPLRAAFTRIMRREVPKQFNVAMKAAMQTAFRR